MLSDQDRRGRELRGKFMAESAGPNEMPDYKVALDLAILRIMELEGRIEDELDAKESQC